MVVAAGHGTCRAQHRGGPFVVGLGGIGRCWRLGWGGWGFGRTPGEPDQVCEHEGDVTIGISDGGLPLLQAGGDGRREDVAQQLLGLHHGGPDLRQGPGQRAQGSSMRQGRAPHFAGGVSGEGKGPTNMEMAPNPQAIDRHGTGCGGSSATAGRSPVDLRYPSALAPGGPSRGWGGGLTRDAPEGGGLPPV